MERLSNKCTQPKMAIMVNHINMIGPNILTIDPVKNNRKKKKITNIISTMYMMVFGVISWKTGIFFKPSIAEVIEMGGVIIPSANKDAPPTIAGITSHLRRRLTNAY